MRNSEPAGKEIAEAAKAVRLDPAKSVEGMKNGKKVKFTGATFPEQTSLKDFEDGQVVGVLETELEGDETTLPSGRHNLYLANVAGTWRVFAESGGEIQAEAKRVVVNQHEKGSKRAQKPGFKQEGWCLFEICLVGFGPFCLISIGICCF